jgi:PEP-CTERM motif-containing protein
MPADIMSTAPKQPWRVVLAIAGLLTGAIAMLTSPARADTIVYNDLTESPTLTHTGAASTVTEVECSGSDEFCRITVSRPGQTLQDISIPLGPLEPLLNLAEDQQLQFLSDQIAPEIVPGTFGQPPDTVQIDFFSAREGDLLEKCADFESPARPGQGCQFQENGQPQGITLFWSNGTDFIAIQSDVESVPEPASWLLLASGLIGLLGFGLRLGFAPSGASQDATRPGAGGRPAPLLIRCQ